MKRKRSQKPKVFNSLNIILIVLVLVEIAFVVNEGVLTGQPVMGAVDEEGVNLETSSMQSTNIADFKSKYGDKWKISYNEKTNTVSSVHGYNIDVETDVNKDNIDTIATDFIENNQDVFRVKRQNLEIVDIQGNKVLFNGNELDQITYKEYYKGLSVYRSRVILTMIDNKIVSFKSDYQPNININIQPKLDYNIIIGGVGREFGLTNDKIPVKKELVIFPIEEENKIYYKLVWKLELPFVDGGFEKWRVFVDSNSGDILFKENTVLTDSISGTVTGEIYPEYEQQSKVEVPFEHETVDVNSFLTNTNESGQFEVTGVSGIVNLVSKFNGPWVKVGDILSPGEIEYKATLNAPSIHSWNWKDYDHSYKKEISNVFYHINLAHDYMKELDIDDMDYQIPVYVNFPSVCNAGYDNVNPTIMFTAPGEVDGVFCDSLALKSDVIYHEYAHGVIHKLVIIDFPYEGETGNLNEGWADYFACSINNNSCSAEGFLGQECSRNCKNTKKYPHDYDSEPHSGLEIISGSIWDYREIVGREIADKQTLDAIRMVPWSFTEFLENMLIVDDDNGDLSDGTPRMGALCDAFILNHGITSDYCMGSTSKPVSHIFSPKDKLNIEDLNDLINILGTAYASKGSIFDRYIIDYSPIYGDEDWKIISIGTTQVVEGILGEFNTTQLNISKSYVIRLRVFDNIGESQTNITLYGKAGRFTRNFWDYGLDTDVNGFFDKLVVKAEIEVLRDDVFPISFVAGIEEPPISLNSKENTSNFLGRGIYNLSIGYNSSEIFQRFWSGCCENYNGTFILSLGLWEKGDVYKKTFLDSFYYETDYYSHEQFFPQTCADLNHDGVRDIIDVSLLINTAFRNGPEPQPKWIGDLDGNNVIDILDVSLLINHAFRNGPVPSCTASGTTTSSTASGTLSISQGTANTDGTTNILVYSNTPTIVSAEKFKLSYNTDISIASIATAAGMDIYRKPAAGGEIINILSSSGSKTIKGNTLILTIKAKNTKGTKDFSIMKLESPLIIDTSSKTYKTVNVQNTIKPPSQTKPTCTDTDKGKAYDIKGTVTITNSSGTFNYQDTCVTSSKLKEFYCNNVQAAFVSYSCPNGCLDGKCKIQEKVVRICTKGKLACAVGKLFGYYQK